MHSGHKHSLIQVDDLTDQFQAILNSSRTLHPLPLPAFAVGALPVNGKLAPGPDIGGFRGAGSFTRTSIAWSQDETGHFRKFPVDTLRYQGARYQGDRAYWKDTTGKPLCARDELYGVTLPGFVNPARRSEGYERGDRVTPDDWHGVFVNASRDFWYVALNDGITGALAPDWTFTPGDLVSDGLVTWECKGRHVYRGFALEPDYQNLIAYSYTMGAPGWTLNGGLVAGVPSPSSWVEDSQRSGLTTSASAGIPQFIKQGYVVSELAEVWRTFEIIVEAPEHTLCDLVIRNDTENKIVVDGTYTYATGVWALTGAGTDLEGYGLKLAEDVYFLAVRCKTTALDAGDVMSAEFYPSGFGNESGTVFIHHTQIDAVFAPTSPFVTNGAPGTKENDLLRYPRAGNLDDRDASLGMDFAALESVLDAAKSAAPTQTTGVLAAGRGLKVTLDQAVPFAEGESYFMTFRYPDTTQHSTEVFPEGGTSPNAVVELLNPITQIPDLDFQYCVATDMSGAIGQNYARSTNMEGAILGLVASGSQLPDGWGLHQLIPSWITIEILQVGADADGTFIEFRIDGVNDSGVLYAGKIIPTGAAGVGLPVDAGDQGTHTARLRRISGSLTSSTLLRSSLEEQQAGSGFGIGGISQIPLFDGSLEQIKLTHTAIQNGSILAASLSFTVQPGESFSNLVFRYYKPQLQAGDSMLDYEHNPLAVARTGDLRTDGTPPTGWVIEDSAPGLIWTLIGSGRENDVPFIECLIDGTTGATERYRLLTNGPNPAPTLAGDTMTASVRYRKLSGSTDRPFAVNLFNGTDRKDTVALNTGAWENLAATISPFTADGPADMRLIQKDTASVVNLRFRLQAPQLEGRGYPGPFVANAGQTPVEIHSPSDYGYLFGEAAFIQMISARQGATLIMAFEPDTLALAYFNQLNDKVTVEAVTNIVSGQSFRVGARYSGAEAQIAVREPTQVVESPRASDFKRIDAAEPLSILPENFIYFPIICRGVLTFHQDVGLGLFRR